MTSSLLKTFKSHRGTGKLATVRLRNQSLKTNRRRNAISTFLYPSPPLPQKTAEANSIEFTGARWMNVWTEVKLIMGISRRNGVEVMNRSAGGSGQGSHGWSRTSKRSAFKAHGPKRCSTIAHPTCPDAIISDVQF